MLVVRGSFFCCGTFISESLKWCEKPVSLQTAADLTGVVLGRV